MTKEDSDGKEVTSTVIVKGADGKVHFVGDAVGSPQQSAGDSPQEEPAVQETDMEEEGQVDDDGEEFIATGELYTPEE